jgi:ATP-dependent DNA helicase RecG
MQLSDPITYIKGLGSKTRDIFESHGIHTIEDLLYFFPRAWINATQVTQIKDLRIGSSALISVQVVTASEGFSQRTRVPYLRATVADTSGSVDIMWFHAAYLKTKVKPGAQFLLYGKLQGWRAQNAMIMSPKFITTPCIIPVYPTIGALPSSRIHALIEQVKPLVATLPDYLPESVCGQYNLVSLSHAITQMHYPNSIEDINYARLRLGFDEVLMLMVPSLMARLEREQERAQALTDGSSEVVAWCRQLPFTLTGDQQKAIQDILDDLSQSKPMNRLIQGDVGTGKTVVGLAGALQAIKSGKQVVWLAPTELLARQHFETAKKIFYGYNQSLTVGLWTRSHHTIADSEESQKTSKEIVTEQSLVIGTHALLSESIAFNNLGLLIIDEQHRFGVKQRSQLRTFHGEPVHLLSMTATPIPRTMALLLYGDLQLSVIKDKPAGRKTIVTRVVEEQNRDKAYEFIDAQITKGGQVYVVCPMIEPSQDAEANVFNQLFETIEEKKAVTVWFEVLQKRFPHRKIGLLHGKLKAKEKESTMEAFRRGELDMLVSTTVIEVGVDVPNASIMLIEAAERFGLAQLHQLRGRVGRGERQSFCLLFAASDKKDNARLKIMEETSNGFILAEKDLELRGPGEMTGLQQSGIPPLRFASLKDAARIAQIREVAQTLMSHPSFKQSLDRFWRLHHPE